MKKEESEHFEIFSYVFGILSIVFGIIQPTLGFGFAVSGLVLVRKNKSDLSRKARKLNIYGIVISSIIILISIYVGYYAAKSGLLSSLK